MVNKCIIALGANLTGPKGPPVETLTWCIGRMKDESIDVKAVGEWYSTPAFPAGAGPDFVNAAVAATSPLSPPDILAALLRIEAAAGRTRLKRWDARVCDLDLLAVDDVIWPDEDTYRSWYDLSPELQAERTPESLILPHPRMHERAFVLVPMRDVAGDDWVHPVSGRTLGDLVAACPAHDVAAIRPLQTVAAGAGKGVSPQG